MIVTKRDGMEVLFDKEKIRKVVSLAFLRERNNANHKKVEIVLENVLIKLTQLDNVNVEYIQDIICDELFKLDEKVATSFKKYRDSQSYKRNIRMEKIINSKLDFIKNYSEASNAATGSKLDANANVEHKNISTMSGEINKSENIHLNRKLMYNKISELYTVELAKEYIRQLESHENYTHDETSIKPYCVAITMYPFLLEGLKGLGGCSDAPKNLKSFCGGFINLVFAIASQFSGAVATAEFLMYMAYFCELEWGSDYYKDKKGIDKIADSMVGWMSKNILHSKYKTTTQQIEDCFSQVVYSINQPAAARDYQSVFWNISIFDKKYFESLFENFIYPDGSKPNWDAINWMQKRFLKWFRAERKKEVLTFPVVTTALLTNGETPVDEEYKDLVAKEFSKGQSMFLYLSENVDSLSSCCRLRNEITENEFSYSLGAGGISTGSINVMTINVNRLVQDGRDIRDEVKKIHKYQIAYRSIINDFLNNGILPAYTGGFINLKKQFLTIGVNGLVEAAESLGIKAQPTDEYHSFVESILTPIYEENQRIKKETGIMFNTEFVPAENLGVKNANWDKNDEYFVPRGCYNSYFYASEDEDLNILDKLILHGKDYIRHLDGGSALHLNLKEHLSKSQYIKLIDNACKLGDNYLTINVKNTVCNNCGFINNNTTLECSMCGSDNVEYATRVIGYLKKISNFSEARQREEQLRTYH